MNDVIELEQNIIVLYLTAIFLPMETSVPKHTHLSGLKEDEEAPPSLSNSMYDLININTELCSTLNTSDMQRDTLFDPFGTSTDRAEFGIALKSYTAKSTAELSVHESDVLRVDSKIHKPGFAFVHAGNAQGFVPDGIIKKISKEEARFGNEIQFREHGSSLALTLGFAQSEADLFSSTKSRKLSESATPLPMTKKGEKGIIKRLID